MEQMYPKTFTKKDVLCSGCVVVSVVARQVGLQALSEAVTREDGVLQ